MTRLTAILLVVCMLALAPLCARAQSETPPAAPAPLALDPAVLAAEAQRVAVIEQASRATLAVLAPGGQGGGSGVVISPDGYALTNYHVVMGSAPYMRCGMNDGELYDCVVVGIDPVGDVALVKLFGRDPFPHVEMGDSDKVRAGDAAIVIGNPFLLATDFKPTVTYGMISGVHRYQYPSGTLLEYADCLQTDASINPGNSGGPLFDVAGRLIGINGRGSFEKRGRVNVGVGYAISIDQIKHFLGCLKSGRIVDHATLGARMTSRDDDKVVVQDVLEDSDAFRRGLQYGDQLTGFAGRPIRTVNAFKNALGIFPKGWRVPLTFLREGKSREISVRLPGVHAEEELFQLVEGTLQPRRQRPGAPGRPRPGQPNPPQPGQPDPAPPQPEQPPPEDEEPKEGSADDPHQPPPLPEIVKRHYEARRGYANYYFNRFHRTRVWEAFAARTRLAGQSGAWRLNGETTGSGAADCELTDAGVQLDLAGGQLKLTDVESLAEASQPPGSGGLLAAMFVWRRLLLLGPEQFGDVRYEGEFPIANYPVPVDTLRAIYGGVETMFHFDPRNGRLVGLELWRHNDEDPCEIRFDQEEEILGRWLPREFKVRFGDETFGTFRWSEVAFVEPQGD